MTYADRHGVCASWHRAPEGWHTWQGHWGGYSRRPYCQRLADHYGDHEARIERIGNETEHKQMTWPQRRRPGETGHQYALRTVEGYALDSEGHSSDCVWRFAEHEECENGDACLRNADIVHECGAVEHLL